MSENQRKIRPSIDESFVYRIKAKYEETKDLNNQDTIAWALNRFLSFQEIVTSPLASGAE